MSPPDNPTSKDLAEKLQLQRSDTHGNFQSFSDATRKKQIYFFFEPFIFHNFEPFNQINIFPRLPET